MIKGTYIGKEEAYAVESNAVRKIVPYLNEVNQTKDKMENRADAEEDVEISIPSFMQNRHATNQRWYYVDMQEHDAAVVRRERERVREVRRKRERQLRYERQKWLENFLYFVKQKLIGLLFIGISVWMCCSGIMYDAVTQTNDCTFLFVTVPIGLMLLFSKERWIIDSRFPDDEDDDEWE